MLILRIHIRTKLGDQFFSFQFLLSLAAVFAEEVGDFGVFATDGII